MAKLQIPDGFYSFQKGLRAFVFRDPNLRSKNYQISLKPENAAALPPTNKYF